MSDRFLDDGVLIAKIMELSENAVRYYQTMSGGWSMTDERFVRDWVAIQLHETEQYTVMIETGRRDYADTITVNTENHEKLGLNRYKLDMVVVKDEKPLAVVEFKRSGKADKDIRRLTKLLSVSSEGIKGYFVAVYVLKGEQQFDILREKFDLITKELRTGKIIERPPMAISKGEYEAWSAILAVQARCDLQSVSAR